MTEAEDRLAAWHARLLDELEMLANLVRRGVIVSCVVGFRTYDPRESDEHQRSLFWTNLHTRPDVTPDTLLALWLSLDERVRKLYGPQPVTG